MHPRIGFKADHGDHADPRWKRSAYNDMVVTQVSYVCARTVICKYEEIKAGNKAAVELSVLSCVGSVVA